MAALNVEIVETSKRVLGQDHPDTLSAMHNLATSYFFLASDHFDANRREQATEVQTQAAAMYEEVIEREKRVLGEEHPTTLFSMGMLAITHMNQGRNEEAERELTELINIRRRTLGGDHPDTLSGLSQLGRLYIKQKKWAQAEAVLSDSSELARRTLGEDHSITATHRYRLGIARFELGRPDAEAILLGAYATFEKTHGPDYEWSWRSAIALSYLYDRDGPSEKAETWRAKVDPKFLAGVEANKRRSGNPYD